MLQSVFLTKLLTLGIIFSTAVNAVFVAKLLASGILFSNSVSFVFLTKSVRSGFFFLILFCLFDIQFSKENYQYQCYLLLPLIYHKQLFQQHHFLLHHSVYSNQQKVVLICQCLIYQLQFSDQLNLFLVQNLKYQRVLHLLNQFLLLSQKDQFQH